MYTIKKGDGNWGREKLLGFVHNPAVEWEPDSEVVPPVEQDESRNQIYVDSGGVSNCRIKPSTSAPILGRFEKGWYDVISTTKADGYTWYEVGEDNYIAKTSHVHYHEEITRYTITKEIPPQVNHSIPDSVRAGGVIDLSIDVNPAYELKKFEVDGEPVINTTYIMPARDIVVSIEIEAKDSLLIRILKAIVTVIK